MKYFISNSTIFIPGSQLLAGKYSKPMKRQNIDVRIMHYPCSESFIFNALFRLANIFSKSE